MSYVSLNLWSFWRSSINDIFCKSNPFKYEVTLVHWALTCDLFDFNDLNGTELLLVFTWVCHLKW